MHMHKIALREGVVVNVRMRPNVFIRSAKNESIVCCPRTGGCTVFSNAKPFLRRFMDTWQNVELIVREIALEFGCPEMDIADDLYQILHELESQNFIECEIKQFDAETRFSEIVGKSSMDNDKNRSFLGDFFRRHNLLSELHMDLTDRCNEACVHCYIPKDGGSLIATEVAFNVIREFRAMEGLSVCISGGECMLHPDFPEILREARRLGLNIIVMSNLTLCDEKMVALLEEIDPQFVNVSLYSMRAEEHDSITRVAGSWERTMAAIRALKAAGVHVRLATPIMRENRDSVDALHRFAEEMNMHDVLDCDIFGRTDHNCANQDHALGPNDAENVIRQYRTWLCHDKLPEDRCMADARVCEVGDFKLNVNAHGNYYPCDGGHGLVLGNAAKDMLADVWRGEKLNALRALKNRDFPKCVGCANRPWCKVCIMRNFNETGDMFTPAPIRCAITAIHRKIWEEK